MTPFKLENLGALNKGFYLWLIKGSSCCFDLAACFWNVFASKQPLLGFGEQYSVHTPVARGTKQIMSPPSRREGALLSQS